MAQSHLLVAGVALALFGSAVGVRFGTLEDLARARRDSTHLRDDVLRSPGRATMQLTSFEHAPAFSDLLWLAIVQELSEPMKPDNPGWDRVQRWTNIAVDLDPKHFTIYNASSVNLIVYAKNSKAARELLMKAREELPLAWEFPFLLGYAAYFLDADASEASTWWELATTLPNVPRFVPSLAARSRFQAGDEDGAIALLETMLDSLEGAHRIDAEIRLKILRSEARLRFYDTACQKFLSERGRRPNDGAELHEAGYVSEPPFDYLGEAIVIDSECRAKTAEIRVREDMARKRLGSTLNDAHVE